MDSLYDYIVTPIGDRYNNKKNIGNKELILNTKIESFKSVNKLAKVISIPKAYNLPIVKEDIVYVHQNVFRRFYNMKGRQQNSRSYFKDDLYFCSPDQIYLYKRKNNINSFLERCFVSPVRSKNLENKVEKNLGILRYGNKTLTKLGVNQGDVVCFPDKRDWEFVVENELLYCMKSKDILLKDERKANQEEYNPSWATSSTGVNKSCKRADSGHGRGRNCGSPEKCSCNKKASNI